jgi:hypothetical protein
MVRKGPELSYSPDPGGIFASDAHRRVMAHLPNPDQDPINAEDLIIDRINKDPHTLAHFDDADGVVKVLNDLETAGYAKHLKGGWRNTKDGFDLLTGPPDETALTLGGAVVLGLDASKLNGDS